MELQVAKTAMKAYFRTQGLAPHSSNTMKMSPHTKVTDRYYKKQ